MFCWFGVVVFFAYSLVGQVLFWFVVVVWVWVFLTHLSEEFLFN